MRTLIYLFTFLLPFTLKADELVFFDEKPFAPHMLDHAHEGCPANSHCSADYGKARFEWTQALKTISSSKSNTKVLATSLEQVRSRVGLPLSVWARPQSQGNPTVSSWESSCRQHNLQNQEIYWAEILVKNLNDQPEQESAFFYNRVALEIKGQPQLIRTPRDSLPTLIKNNKLYYTLGENGVYYGLLIDPEGTIEVINPLTIKQQPREVVCPEVLKKKLQSWNYFDQVYERVYCRAVWDETSKKWRTIAVGWAC